MKKTFLYAAAALLHIAAFLPLSATASDDIWDNAWGDVMRLNNAQTSQNETEQAIEAWPAHVYEHYPEDAQIAPAYPHWQDGNYDVATQPGGYRNN